MPVADTSPVRGPLASLVLVAILCLPVSVSAQEAPDEPLWGRGGFVPVFGGLGQTAGITAGLRYDAFLRNPNYTLAADALGSLRGYAGLRGVAGFERDVFAAYAFGRYRYMPREMFYGLGDNTDLDDGGDYRIDDRLLGISAAARPAGRLTAGLHVSILDNRFGTGRDGDTPPIVDVHPETEGVGEDSRYGILGAWIEVDGREHVQSPDIGYHFAPVSPALRGLDLGVNRGWYASAEVIPYFSTSDDLPDFLRVELEGQVFIPTDLATDGFAFRSHLAVTSRGEDQLPFYMLPALGGSSSIRGFRPNRFRDAHALLFNAEYRRALLLFLDAAAFVDAGQTFSEADQVSLSAMEFGYGIGLRTRVGRFVLGRVDIARSHEGFHVYLRAGTFL